MFSFLNSNSKTSTLNKKEYILLEGLVSIDSKPSFAEIEITSAHKHKNFSFNTKTDSLGNFKTNLPGGDDYEIVVKVRQFPQQIIIVSTLTQNSDSSLNVYVDFTSPDYDKKINELKRHFEKESKKQALKFDEASFVKNFGNIEKENIVYKIQVGAFKFFENFNYSLISGMPKIIRKTGHDYITRFTMGNYKTYNQALVLLNQIKNTELKGAFIVAFVNEEQKTLSELLSNKLLN